MSAMPKYAGTLLPEHLALVEQVRDHRMRVGLSTDRCDRPAAEAAVRLAYKKAGLAEPPLMVWMDSPLGGAFAAATVTQLFKKLPAGLKRGQLWDQLGGQLGGQLGDQLWDQLGGQLWDQLWDQLRGQLGGQLRGQLGDQLRGQLRDQLWDQLGGQLGGQLRGQLGGQLRGQLRDQLRGQLGDQLRGQLRDQLGDQLRGQLGDQLRGQLWDQLRGQLGDQLGDQLDFGKYLDPWYEAYWLGIYAAALPAAGLPADERLTALTTAVDNTAWWWPMRGAVILTDRPTALHMETAAGQTRLHCETGPAIGYADGYGLWSWHGTRVPQDLIETGWDTNRILEEQNAEIRRCAIERMGWDDFVIQAGLTQVGETVPDPGNPGKDISLYDVPERIYGDVGVRVLLCTNGTPERDGTVRRFGLTVPEEIGDPVAAAAWGYGLTRPEYAGALRRT